MDDATNGALLREIEGEHGWRVTLRACNQDKSDVQKLIEQANKPKETSK